MDFQKNIREQQLLQRDWIAKSFTELEDISKGGKAAVLGEVREFGGKKYKKTDKGWRPVGKKEATARQEQDAAASRVGSAHAHKDDPADFDNQKALNAWKKYLEQNPTGPNAENAKGWIGHYERELGMHSTTTAKQIDTLSQQVQSDLKHAKPDEYGLLHVKFDAPNIDVGEAVIKKIESAGYQISRQGKSDRQNQDHSHSYHIKFAPPQS